MQKNITLQGSFSHNWPIWERVIRLLSTGQLDVKPDHRRRLAAGAVARGVRGHALGPDRQGRAETVDLSPDEPTRIPPRPAATSLATFALPARAGGPGISHVSVQLANGRRLTPVAPNAYAPYRGYDVRESVLRIRTVDGLEGIGRLGAKPEVLKRLLGVDP